MKKITLLSCALIISSFSFSQTKAPTLEEYGQVIEKMKVSIAAIKTTSFDFVKNERYKGKIVNSKQFVKQNVSPSKIYMHLLEGPNSGTELLFIPAENGGKARVSAGKFVPTISLSPFSDLVRDNQRNTIYELGFSYMGNLIYKNYLKYKDKGQELIDAGWAKYEGIIKYDGRDCHKITMENKDYAIIKYTVKEGDNCRKIAKELLLDEYSFYELNPAIKSSTDIKPGQVIMIPNTFCQKILVYIDVATSLPVYQKIWDTKGVVGEYAFLNLKINPTFAADEFTEKFAGYGF